MALFTSVLRDFFKGHEGGKSRAGAAARARAGDSETEGVA